VVLTTARASSAVVSRVMRKRIVPLLIVLGVVGLLVYQLVGEGKTECRVCVTFKGSRQCSTAVAPDKDKARKEAQSSACSLIAHGVTDSFACPQVPPDEVTCSIR
jgi:hypothetical protein